MQLSAPKSLKSASNDNLKLTREHAQLMRD